MNKFKLGDRVICIDDSFNTSSLTIYRTYIVLRKPDVGSASGSTIWVVNNNGIASFYDYRRFISLTEYRSKTIDGILE